MASPPLSQEARLLFQAMRPKADRAAGAAQLIEQGVDWRALLQLAGREKLLPVLWRGLSEVADRIPAAQSNALRGLAAAAEFSMAAREETLVDAVEQLTGAGHRVVLLKGAALGKTVYPSFTVRPMGDLDLLLRRDEVEQGWQALRDAGWKLEIEDGRADYEHHHHLPPLVDPTRPGSVVELHQALVPAAVPFVLEEDVLWSEAEPLTVGSATAWVPSARWLLLHLGVHFAWSNQLERGLGNAVRDVATLLAVDPPDPAAFIDLAGSSHTHTVCYWTLRLSRALVGAGVSEQTLKALQPTLPNAALASLESSFIASALTRSNRSVRLGQMRWSVGIQPRASGLGVSRPWKEGEVFG